MNWTTESFKDFVGGQIEIRDHFDDEFCRGVIKSLEVVPDQVLKITTLWEARFSIIENRWEENICLDQAYALGFCNLKRLENGRIFFQSGAYETVTLIPSKENRLERTKIFPPKGTDKPPAHVVVVEMINSLFLDAHALRLLDYKRKRGEEGAGTEGLIATKLQQAEILCEALSNFDIPDGSKAGVLTTLKHLEHALNHPPDALTKAILALEKTP